MKRSLLGITLLVAASTASAQTLTASTVMAPAGGYQWVAFTLSEPGDIVGLEGRATFAPGLEVAVRPAESYAITSPDCRVNPALGRNLTGFGFEPRDCTPGTDCRAVRFIVLGSSMAAITEPLPDGEWVFGCAVRVRENVAVDAALSVTCDQSRGGRWISRADDLAENVPISCRSGAVIVTDAACLGDGNGDGAVTVDEVVGAVNSALVGCGE